MIKVHAEFRYNCDTKAEVEWVISNLPAGTQYTVDWLTKTVIYSADQQVTKPE